LTSGHSDAQSGQTSKIKNDGLAAVITAVTTVNGMAQPQPSSNI